MGMKVCASTANGADAVAKAQERKPDLVLIDLAMPMMNGIDAASAIKKAAPATRIVVFTLYSDSLGELLARATGVDIVVSKTEGATGLLHALGHLLAKQSQSTSCVAV